jgi:hypothetical protein
MRRQGRLGNRDLIGQIANPPSYQPQCKLPPVMAFMAFDALLDAGRTSRNLEIATLAQFARDVMRDVLRPAFCGRTSISRSTDKSLPGTPSV